VARRAAALSRRLAGRMRVSFDRANFDLGLIHSFLSQAYWSVGIPRDTVERAVRGSLCVAALATNADGAETQVGFARVISDRATFAYLADVFVLPPHRGHSLGKRVMTRMIDEGPGRDFRWVLFTKDAHTLYTQYGFEEPDATAMVRRAAPHMR
jgi:GNAT superfamily N-acetyltransferase